MLHCWWFVGVSVFVEVIWAAWVDIWFTYITDWDWQIYCFLHLQRLWISGLNGTIQMLLLLLFFTLGSKDPRVSKIKMPDGHRSGRSTGRVSCKSTELKRCSMIEMRWNKYEVSLASPVWIQIWRPSSEIKFRVVELKTPRFSIAIGSNLYAEDRVEYFSVFLVAVISVTVPASVAALST